MGCQQNTHTHTHTHTRAHTDTAPLPLPAYAAFRADSDAADDEHASCRRPSGGRLGWRSER
eukprot:8881833-Pyramimonas_sp.AAC.1